jgi:phosphopantetheinyl transferase (holo-ACP synthase)
VKAPRTFIVSCIEQVALAGAQRNRARWLTRHFSKSERALLRDRPARTVAAMLALKRATGRVLAHLSAQRCVAACHIGVAYTAEGAPRVVGLPRVRGVTVPALRVSVTHSRRTAFALVACESSAPAARKRASHG